MEAFVDEATESAIGVKDDFGLLGLFDREL